MTSAPSTNTNTPSIEGTSSERSRAVHALRNLTLVVPVLALALVTSTVAANVGPLSESASGSLPTASADLESAVAIHAAPENGAGATAGVERQADPDRRASTPPAGPTASEDPSETPSIVVPAAPTSARLEAGPVERIVDTRGAANTDPSTVALPTPGAAVRAMVLSISIVGSDQAGTVRVQGSYGSIDAVTVGGSGASMSNSFVVVPGTDPSTIANPTGGDLVVDLVATFVAAGPSASGRLLTVEPIRLATLVTTSEGRETTVDLTGRSGIDPAVTGTPSAALVLITADVGDDGGQVALGPDPSQLDQTLMWGPPGDGNRLRSDVALITPGPDGRFALRYDGGSVLDVDLIAYVTGADAPTSSEGLFLPVTTVARFDRTFAPGLTVVEPAAPSTASAIVNVRAALGAASARQPAELATDLTVASGRTIGTVLPVVRGPGGGPGIAVTSEVQLDATIQPLGYLLAATT